MNELRPGTEMSLEEFFRMNFAPGIHRYYREVACLNDEEYRKQREQINSTLRARGLPEITEERD